MTATETAGSITQTRRLWQQQAALALVAGVNPASSSVAVVDFDSSATTLIDLTPLSTGLAAVQAAINSVDASGGTNIPSGIDLARTVLAGATGSRHMIVSSDGATIGNSAAAAAAAAAAGITVHSIAMPGADITTMQSIATSGGGSFINASNPANLTTLINLLAGIGGNLVAIDRVDIEMPDGVLLSDVPLSGLGEFSTPDFALKSGPNTFKAFAYGTDGTSATATLTLIGKDGGGGPGGIPEPSTYVLLGSGLAAVLLRRRRA
jgi:hypothetical protein